MDNAVTEAISANTAAVRCFTAGRPYIHASGSGLVPSVVWRLQRAGLLHRTRTGSATIYSLKGMS